ncbi:hypothetical protein ACHHZ9_20285, partial [Enterobacter cloacae complex sp. 2024EL-00232]|nr:hypothetical protein [Enterobacter cloacae complex sp. 2021EL-01261]
MSTPAGGSSSGNSGFTYQGKKYDSILQEPMIVSAETHGDFWEDDMDYSEAVSYEGVDSKDCGQDKADEKSCKNCPPDGKVMPMVRRCSRWSEVTINYQTGLAPIFPYTFYHLTHDWFVAADIPVANDTPVHYADAIRCNVR